MGISKRGHMVYIGETTSSNGIYDIEPKTLQKGEIYWVEYVEYNSVLPEDTVCLPKARLYIYHKNVENVEDAYISDHYIGCNNNGTDVCNDFIALAEWREQQMKAVLDD